MLDINSELDINPEMALVVCVTCASECSRTDSERDYLHSRSHKHFIYSKDKFRTIKELFLGNLRREVERQEALDVYFEREPSDSFIPALNKFIDSIGLTINIDQLLKAKPDDEELRDAMYWQSISFIKAVK